MGIPTRSRSAKKRKSKAARNQALSRKLKAAQRSFTGASSTAAERRALLRSGRRKPRSRRT